MIPSFLKSLLPNHTLPLPILNGPFRGATIHLNPRYSLRKVFGIYEHELNKWLESVLSHVDTVIDVGANDGYFTYGCAQAIKRHYNKGHIIGFEPALAQQPALSMPAVWSQYAGIDFEFIPLFVGAISNESTITLDKAYNERPSLHGKPALIKVDVEGAEVEVLKGATSLLEEPHHWVVEVHGDHLLDPVLDCFAKAKRPVDVRPPQPHWLLGPESRTIKTSWVTTKATTSR
jgi:hypothetical protein